MVDVQASLKLGRLLDSSEMMFTVAELAIVVKTSNRELPTYLVGRV